MIAPAPTRRASTARLVRSSGLSGLLLAGALATAAPAEASLPVEHDSATESDPRGLVLVNGVHTLAGVTAKLARLP